MNKKPRLSEGILPDKAAVFFVSDLRGELRPLILRSPFFCLQVVDSACSAAPCEPTERRDYVVPPLRRRKWVILTLFQRRKQEAEARRLIRSTGIWEDTAVDLNDRKCPR